MKKNQVNAIFVAQAKRKRIMYQYICTILLLMVVLCYFIYLNFSKSQIQMVNYKQTSDVDYEVYLKENDFFEQDYLSKENQYIASLIENIKANFHYSISPEKKDMRYACTYKILAEVDVREKNSTRSLYNFQEVLLEDRTKSSDGQNNPIAINEQIVVDYHHYNDLIHKFIDLYELDNTVSTLTLNMYVDLKGEYDENSKTSIISLNIPLTTKTVEIEMASNVMESKDNYMIYKTPENYKPFYYIVILVLAVVNGLLLIKFIHYMYTSKTPETIYETSLKHILNNYRSYIQKINNEIDLAGYKEFKVDTFKEMIEIRETIEQPILMVENEEKTETKFIIITKTDIVYVYELKLSNIKKYKK